MASAASRLAPLTVDHLMRLEELGEVALSPDGRWLAYVVKRPRATAQFHHSPFLFGGDRGDIWLFDTANGQTRNLTGGEVDGSGYWAPSWSADSSRLAMLSTNGGNIHVWGCEVASGSLARLCDRPADCADPSPYRWVSDRHVLVATLPEGERSFRMTVEVQAAEVAMREWPKAWRGEEPTVSALDSGSHAPFGERPQGELCLVDAAGGEEQTVMTGFFRDLRVGPDRRHVAFQRQVDVVRPEPGRKLPREGWERRRIGVVTAGGEVVSDGLDGIEAPLSGSLRWSLDGAEIALIGRPYRSVESPTRVFRYRLADGHVEPLTGDSLEPTAVLWTAGTEVLVLAKTTEYAIQAGQARPDWWLVRPDAQPRKVTGELAAVPHRLVRQKGRDAFVGVAGGDVVRLSVEEGRCENLTADVEARIAWLVWPSADTSDDHAVNELIVAVVEGALLQWHRLDLDTRQLSRLSSPATRESRLHFSPAHDTAVHVAAERTGARLWHSKPAFEQDTLVHETNSWLADIAEGEVRRVDYRDRGGNDLVGWLILPVDHEPGRRCPLITCVFPGLVFGGHVPPSLMVSIAGHHAFNLQLLAARGYAVLLPSMPIGQEEEPSDPHLKIANGVLPALDNLVGSGVADPDRLGVMGHSRGGYGTYSLITQTDRFKAAVALAGYADLVSLYGQFDARLRYTDHPHEHLFNMVLAEVGPSQHRMGGPPWEDPQRYIRNSPLFHADRVTTPLLIIQGDMDYVAVQQGEQFFNALYRQAKRARFLRYWSEGHVFQSPANIQSMWDEIYEWFKQHLKPAASNSQTIAP
jgi:dipeptidyl aminopeptidase/acylaminoacyl peptidase